MWEATHRRTSVRTGDGTWVETRKGEQSISDAFEIQAQRNAKGARSGLRARETQPAAPDTPEGGSSADL